MQRQSNPVNPRDEAEMQLRSALSQLQPMDRGNRADQLSIGQASATTIFPRSKRLFEISVPLGYNARLSLVASRFFSGFGTSRRHKRDHGCRSRPLPVLRWCKIPQPIRHIDEYAATTRRRHSRSSRHWRRVATDLSALRPCRGIFAGRFPRLHVHGARVTGSRGMGP